VDIHVEFARDIGLAAAPDDSGSLQAQLLCHAASALAAGGHLLGEALGLPNHTGGVVQQLAVAVLHPWPVMTHGKRPPDLRSIEERIHHRQLLIEHLAMLQVLAVEGVTAGKQCRRDDERVPM